MSSMQASCLVRRVDLSRRLRARPLATIDIAQNLKKGVVEARFANGLVQVGVAAHANGGARSICIFQFQFKLRSCNCEPSALLCAASARAWHPRARGHPSAARVTVLFPTTGRDPAPCSCTSGAHLDHGVEKCPRRSGGHGLARGRRQRVRVRVGTAWARALR